MAKPSLFLAITVLLLHFFAIFGGMWNKINQIGTSNTKVVLFQKLGDDNLIFVIKPLSKSLNWGLLFKIRLQGGHTLRVLWYRNKGNLGLQIKTIKGKI